MRARCLPILVVDDEFDMRSALAYFLGSYGYTVLTAPDADEALRTLRAGTRVGLIVFDLRLPRRDGTAFRMELLRDTALAAIPVIICSGDCDLKAKAAALEASAYCEKPVDCEALLALINTHCLTG